MDVKVTIQGTTPLLCNAFPLTPVTAKKVAKGDVGSPRDEAKKKLYVHDGQIGIPGKNLFSCFVAAGKHIKVGRSKMTTMVSSLVPTFLTVETMFCPIQPGEWEVDTQPVVNPSTRGRMLCHRPRFDQWEMDCVLSIDLNETDKATARFLIDTAGVKEGLGDYRPARKGLFGRFVVKCWKELD